METLDSILFNLVGIGACIFALIGVVRSYKIITSKLDRTTAKKVS